MDPTLTPLQVAARNVAAAKSSEHEIAALRARVEALESKQAAPAASSAAAPAPVVELTKEEQIQELNRQIEATTDNAEIWRISAELDKLRWS